MKDCSAEQFVGRVSVAADIKRANGPTECSHGCKPVEK
jgi:hypothetical protein